MKSFELEIRDKLFEMQDLGYKEFSAKLMPTVSSDKIIGVRTPLIRNLAKEIYKKNRLQDYIKNLPHKYYEENNLHGFLIEKIKDFDLCIAELDRFLPYVNNWATCDSMTPKILKKKPDKLYEKIKIWVASGDTYTVRFGIKLLMNFYLDDLFNIEYANLVASVKSDEYYINMMIAWYFATALAKQEKAVLPFLEEKRLSNWIHNKTIQKSVESFRISDDLKIHLKSLKIK
jgi:3-methyladenine DNA glycosylase AlkD